MSDSKSVNPSDEEKNAANGTPPADNADKKKTGSNSKNGDASRGEVAIYAFGNVEGAIADRFPETLQNILIVVAHMNPLLLGLVMGLRTLWDGIMDPIMAHISDNTQSKYGRRRPYILFGGVSRVLFLVAFIAFMPLGTQVSENPLMEAQKYANEAAQVAEKNFETTVKSYEQLPSAELAIQTKILDMMEGSIAESWFTQVMAFFGKKEDHSFLGQAQESIEKIDKYLPMLENDLAERQALVAQIKENIAELEAAGASEDSTELQRERSLLAKAEERAQKARNLIAKTEEGLSKAIAIRYAVPFMLGVHGRIGGDFPETPESAQEIAAAQMREAGVEVIDIFQLEPAPAPKPREVKVPFSGLVDGLKAFVDPGNFEQRTLIIYLLVGYLIFATLATINSAPYYALGIEISPSYDGRTQVVVYRSIMNKIAGLLAPWVPVFCFSLWFTTAFDALFWVAVFACVIGIPSTVLMFFKTRERTRATIKKGSKRPNLFKSMWEIGKEPNFLRILFLFVFIGLVNGLFQQIGFFLNVYWVTGSALSGATLGAQVAMLAWGLGLIQLPAINWACRRFQKHRVLQFAIVWMAIGTALKWWLMDPEHPEYQFILPFFFSIGIGSVYTVLPTLMADVTDLDELRHGVRREGMFGAVMGFLMKTIGTAVPIAAGAVLVISGFDPSLEYRQEAQTILNMRILYSFVPAVMLLFALVVLFRYPLTRERVMEIKEELRLRHEAEEAEEAGENA